MFISLTIVDDRAARSAYLMWSMMETDDEKNVYIQAAKERPDPRLRDENFYLGRYERELVSNTIEDDRRDFEHFIFGARIDHPANIGMFSAFR